MNNEEDLEFMSLRREEAQDRRVKKEHSEKSNSFVVGTSTSEAKILPLRDALASYNYLQKREKRSRVKNYSKKEEILLIDEVVKNKDIIENKKTDAFMWKIKSACWDEISRTFTNKGYQRSPTHLRSKYETMKKNVRAKAKLRQDDFQNGRDTSSPIELTEIEEKILQLILLGTEGIFNHFDSDTLDKTRLDLDQDRPSHGGENNEDISVVCEVDVADWSSSDLGTPVPVYQPLKRHKSNSGVTAGPDETEESEAPETVSDSKQLQNTGKRVRPHHVQVTQDEIIKNKIAAAKIELEIKEMEKKEYLKTYERAEELHQIRLKLLEAELKYKMDEERRKEEKHKLEIQLLKSQLNNVTH